MKQKEGFEFNPQKNFLLLQHGYSFFVYSSKHGRRDVMWTYSIGCFFLSFTKEGALFVPASA